VVNVGLRQRGRWHGANVIDAAEDTESIEGALRQALAPAFRASLAALENPYAVGHAAEIILRKLEDLPGRETLLMKKFQDA
jgi:hypothetical protein